VGTTVKQLKTSILFIVMQCCFSQVTFLNYSIVFYNCYVPELSCLQDANSSTEALNRLQGVILYSSPGEGIRLEYPAIKEFSLLLLYLAASSFFRVRVYLDANLSVGSI
jgi:hypothetical protein